MGISFDISSENVSSFERCICCDSTNLDVISRVFRRRKAGETLLFLETSACRNCGHIQRTKAPSEDWMLSNFKYRDDIQREMGFSPINEQVESFRYEKYKLMAASFRDNVFHDEESFSSACFLDIGCGPGTGLKAFLDMGLKAIGIEPDESRARYGLSIGMPIHISTWEEFDFKNSGATAFLSIQSLEHFYKPFDFLGKIYKDISGDFPLLIDIPDSKGYCVDWNDNLYMGHLNNFSENSLLVMLSRLGFKSVKRVFPYGKEHLNSKYLSVICHKNYRPHDTHLPYKTSSEVSEFITSKRSDLCRGLPGSIRPTIPTNFFVNEINDLMLIYKKDPLKIKSSVLENQSSRSIVRLNDSNQDFLVT